MRKKNVKPTSPGKHTALGPGWGPQLDSRNKTTLGALEKHIPASRVQWLSRPGVRAPGCSWQGGLGSLSLGKEEQHLGVGWGFSPGSPLSPPPTVERTQTDSSVGGGGGLAPQALEGCPGPQDENRAPRTEGRRRATGGKVQRHQSHSEHDSTGRAGAGEINTKPGRSCPGLPAPQECGAGFGRLGESLWRSGHGDGQGACGWGLGRKGRRQRLRREAATRTTPSWK